MSHVNVKPPICIPSYECAINIEDLIKLSDVMAEHSLGPNGGKLDLFLFFLFSHFEAMLKRLKQRRLSLAAPFVVL